LKRPKDVEDPILRRMENGSGVYGGYHSHHNYQDTYRNVYTINMPGQVRRIFGEEIKANMVLGDYKEGLFYYSDKGRRVDGKHGNNQGFFNISGELVIDLSKYDMSNKDIIAFSDGYCFLVVRNPQGTEFYTIIDKSGKEMFAPRIYSYAERDLKNGIYIIQNGEESFSIMNTSGDEVGRIGQVENVSNFNEDVALVEKGVEIFYIDKTGKRLF